MFKWSRAEVEVFCPSLKVPTTFSMCFFKVSSTFSLGEFSIWLIAGETLPACSEMKPSSCSASE